VIGGWRKLHNEELHNLYSYTSYNQNDQVKEMGRICSTNREKINSYRVLVGKLEGKRPLRRPRRRWAHKAKIYLREIEWGGVDWTDLAEEGSCEHGNEPLGS
jgi:hypothetical protein